MPNLIEEIESLGEESGLVGEDKLLNEAWDLPPLPSQTYFKLKQGESLAILGRDTDDISNDVDLSLPRDNRRWSPTSDYDPGEIVSGSSSIKSFEPPPDFMPQKGNDPDWEKFRREIWNTPPKPVRKPWKKDNLSAISFRAPSYVEICAKRKIRREVMHALGISGVFHFPRHFTPFSRVHC